LGVTPAFGQRDFSEETAREIDCAVREIAKTAFDRAVTLLKERRDTLEHGAQRLLQKETLNEEDLQALRKDLPGADTADESRLVCL
jgi:cell division protease FtsH